MILDMRNLGWEHMDKAFIKHFVDMLSIRYPERLHRLIMFPVSLTFRSGWATFKMFLDPVSVKKVVILGECAGLLDYIEPSQLSTEDGGLDLWRFDGNELIAAIETRDMSIFSPSLRPVNKILENLTNK